MTAKIKLNAASGGGSVSLQAPSNTDQNRVISLPVSADGTILTTTNPKAGNILQVVQAVKTDTFSHLNEAFTDITGLSVSITPTSSSSKVLIRYGGCLGSGSNRIGHIRLMKGSTAIFVGTSASSSQAAASSTCVNKDAYFVSAFGGEFLDSPSTTSATTYKLQIAAGDQDYQVHVGRSHDNNNEFSRSRTPSFITVMEVAA